MKKNKPFGELYYHSLKKILLTTRIAVILMILGILQAYANDTYTRKILTESSELQQRTITGTVSDENGKPLPGVNVQVEGTTFGAITDINGKYSITKPNEDAILVFSFIGYNSQKVSASGKTTIDIQLVPALTGLEEVVVVGYGTQKKVNLTGSVDVITNKELSNRQVPTVSQLLQGLSPSTNFTITDDKGFQPGATMAMTIRGIGSLNGGQPYILINGVPGDMNNLNPKDIESVSVLKDAASSAIYGARAAYGVVLITTKKGGKDEKMSFTYSGAVSLKTPPPLPKALDSYTWARVMNESGDNAGGGHPFSNLQLDQIVAYQNKNWDYLKQFFAPGQTVFGLVADGNYWNADAAYADNDWWDIYYGHSINQKHDISLQGGTKNASYYFSAGYLSDEGVLNYGTDKFQRVNILGKTDIAITDWWDFSWEPRLSNKKRERPHMTNEGDYGFMFREIARTYPFVPLYDGWGVLSWESHIPSILGGGTDSWNEIDAWNNFKTEIRPLKGWKINADFAYNFYQGITTKVQKTIYQHNVDNSYTASGVSIPNNITRTQNDNQYWNANIYSSYNLSIKSNHNFGILAGVQMERGLSSELGGYKTDLIVPDVPSFQTATGNAILWENLSHRALSGYFSRLSYNYKEKYLLESNVRYDGSYVFREGNRWGFFPSFSAGWNVNKEPFWNNLEKYINTLKVRASWGSLGNQNVAPYSDLELLQLQTGKLPWIFDFGGTQPIGYTSASGLVNKNLAWETATAKEIGADMSFLNNRLTAGLNLYERLTTDMVGPSEAKPGVLGADVPSANNSTLRTRGWELTLNWKQNFESGFSYFINLNVSNYKSIVTKYFNPTGTLSTWYE
ncbi:MAG: SusC/RagA family TonB-linked outer membrane protein, partial [Bacteroidales bacterium]